MTKEQAEALAALIKSQFNDAYVLILESADTRKAPHDWFVVVESSSTGTRPSLFLHSEYEWQEALIAYTVLKALE